MGVDTSSSTSPDTSKDANANTGANVDTKDTGKVGDNTGSTDTGTGTDDKGKDDAKELKDTLTKVRKERDALLKAQRDAELAKLPELERAKAQVDELTKANEKLDLENRRYKVGMKLGLPWSIAKRLTGDTDEEMEADGAELLKEYKGSDGKRVIDDPANKKKTPPNDAKRDGKSGQPGMNDILRALRRG